MTPGSKPVPIEAAATRLPFPRANDGCPRSPWALPAPVATQSISSSSSAYCWWKRSMLTWRRERPRGKLHRRDRVSLVWPLAVLARRPREARDQLGAQIGRLNHRIDHKLGCQVEDVDVLGVLQSQLLGPRRALIGVVDRLQLVVVDR